METIKLADETKSKSGGFERGWGVKKLGQPADNPTQPPTIIVI